MEGTQETIQIKKDIAALISSLMLKIMDVTLK